MVIRDHILHNDLFECRFWVVNGNGSVSKYSESDNYGKGTVFRYFGWTSRCRIKALYKANVDIQSERENILERVDKS